MKKIIIPFLILLLFAVGCRANSPDVTNQANQPNAQNLPAEDSGQTTNVPPDNQNAETISEEAQCYGEDIHPIGQSIAELYPEITDYNQVMTWFCTGFEFEDIITALETQTETGIPADELLTLFQNGQTWDEIWVDLGVVGN